MKKKNFPITCNIFILIVTCKRVINIDFVFENWRLQNKFTTSSFNFLFHYSFLAIPYDFNIKSHFNVCVFFKILDHRNNIDEVLVNHWPCVYITAGVSEDSSLKRICRCTDMIQKSTNQILSSTTFTSPVSDGNSTSSLTTEDSRLDQLDVAGQEIQFATSTLTVLVKRALELVHSSFSSPSKSTKLTDSPLKGVQNKIRRFAAADLSEICWWWGPVWQYFRKDLWFKVDELLCAMSGIYFSVQCFSAQLLVKWHRHSHPLMTFRTKVM